MARLPLSKKKQTVAAVVTIYTEMMKSIAEILIEIFHVVAQLCVKIPRPINYLFDDCVDDRVRARFLNIKSIIKISDEVCINNIRMDRNCFDNLCGMLRDIGGLRGNKNMDIGEMVALFLYTLAHNKKNRTMQVFFRRSGETISRHFTAVLHATLKCYNHLLKKPEPVTADCSEENWSCFKNCLGALDGTHVKVRVGENDKVRYKNRKGEISTNVLGVCSRDLQFIYILPGWEGSAHDNRVLRDALTRKNPLKVPQDCRKNVMASNPKEKQATGKGNSTIINVRWGNTEDATLVKSLMKLIEDGGWKAENNQLKSGAYGKLEKIMEEMQPGCGMKARPHIESRVRLLRRQYYAIEEMRGPNCSGFGWNESEKSISCDKRIFEDWVKSHPNAKGLRNKSFPHYDELSLVFGKDRANGEGVESPADAVEEITNDEEDSPEQQFEKQKENSEDEVSPKINGQSTDTNSRGSKRPKTDSLEIVKELTFGLQKISKVMENGNENIAKLTSCFQHESDVAKKRMLVNSELMKVSGLKEEEIIKAGRKIVLDPLETDYFFSLPEDFRSTYVHTLLLPDS